MPARAGCPRCSADVVAGGAVWTCPNHGRVPPLWRPGAVTYEEFVGHLERTPRIPTYLPWPLPPQWTVTDFASVGDAPGLASLVSCSGASSLDGPVELVVVSEEPGTGLGGRAAGLGDTQPRLEVSGPPTAHVRIHSSSVPLWAVSTSTADNEFDRSVVAGEADGRWLWLVLRPASAILLLQEEWPLRDLSELGPGLVELPFGGAAPLW